MRQACVFACFRFVIFSQLFQFVLLFLPVFVICFVWLRARESSYSGHATHCKPDHKISRNKRVKTVMARYCSTKQAWFKISNKQKNSLRYTMRVWKNSEKELFVNSVFLSVVVQLGNAKWSTLWAAEVNAFGPYCHPLCSPTAHPTFCHHILFFTSG